MRPSTRTLTLVAIVGAVALVVAVLAMLAGRTTAQDIHVARLHAGSGIDYTTAWVEREVKWYDSVLRAVGIEPLPSSAELHDAVERAKRSAEELPPQPTHRKGTET
jgi:hypothetical protein